jgi:hypothetical protein
MISIERASVDGELLRRDFTTGIIYHKLEE